jgi:DNA-binding CsgD family transcriptional regulator
LIEAEPGGCVIAAGSVISDIGAALDQADAIVIDFEEEVWPGIADSLAGRDLALVLLGAELAIVSDDADVRGWAALARDASGPEIVTATRAALQGLIVYDPALSPSPTQALHPGETLTLTQRELAVLQSMSDGLANKQIALKLGISIHTVKFHVAAVLSKLGVSSRTEAVTVGMRSGLIRL